MKKNILAIAAGLAMAAGSASAVELSQGGKGDLLIAPMLMAVGSWQSELKVINTNISDSIVAKVVFHENTFSDEVLDFLIFLSPGDVWTGRLVVNADGSIGIASDDPSSITVSPDPSFSVCPASKGITGFRSDEAKFKIPTNFAYAVIYETRTIKGLGSAPVAKDKILDAYNKACVAGTPIAAADTDNALTGTVTLTNAVNGNKVSIAMKALADYNNSTYHNIGDLTDFVTNTSGTSQKQIEDALWSSFHVVPFANGAGQATLATVTFPTKRSYAGGVGSQYTPFLILPPARGRAPVSVKYVVRNEEEEFKTVCAFSPCNTVLWDELNFVSLVPGGKTVTSTANSVFTENFTKGWLSVDLFQEPSDTAAAPPPSTYNNLGKNGGPAIVTYFNWEASLGSTVGYWDYAPQNSYLTGK